MMNNLNMVFVLLCLQICGLQNIAAQQYSSFDSLKMYSVLTEQDLKLTNASIDNGVYVGGKLVLDGFNQISGSGLKFSGDTAYSSLICNDGISFENSNASLVFTDNSILKTKVLQDFVFTDTPESRHYHHKDVLSNKIILPNTTDSLFADVSKLVDQNELFRYYRAYSSGLLQCTADGLTHTIADKASLTASNDAKSVFTLNQGFLDAVDTLAIQGSADVKIIINIDLRFSANYTLDHYIVLDGVTTDNIVWNVLTNQGIQWSLRGEDGGLILNAFSNLVMENTTAKDYQIVAKSADLKGIHFAGSPRLNTTKACVNCPVNFVSLGGHKQLCKGTKLEICPDIIAGTGPYTYKWNDGSTGDCLALEVNDHDFIRLEIEDALGCISVDEIYIEMLETPVAVAGQDVEICGVQPITLTASGGDVYTWSTGERAQSIIVTPLESTSYTVIVENSNGCSDIDSTLVIIENMASIEGVIYDDINYDAIQNGQEKGVAGVTVRLQTTGNIDVTSAVTDSLGQFKLEGCPGNYLIEVDLPAGYNDADMSSSRSGLVELSDGEVVEEFNIALRSGTVVPLEWVDFNLIFNDHTNIISLNWMTAHEVNVDRFEIYHSTEGSEWAYVNDHEASNSIRNTYVYEDARRKGDIHYYRIKQIDLNGDFSWSAVKKIELGKSDEVEISFYPNPTRDILHLNYSRPIKMEVDIYTRMGQKVEADVVDNEISLKHLPNGNYIISFRNDETDSVSVDSFTKM